MSNSQPLFPDPQAAPEPEAEGPPEMIPLRSTYLDAAGYDPARHELLVAFRDGNTIAYSGVPASTLNALVNSPSPGRWLHANLHGLPYRLVS